MQSSSVNLLTESKLKWKSGTCRTYVNLILLHKLMSPMVLTLLVEPSGKDTCVGLSMSLVDENSELLVHMWPEDPMSIIQVPHSIELTKSLQYLVYYMQNQHYVHN